jgi:hypothetical protein
MDIAKSRKTVSRFTFHRVFLASLRAGYLKRLDLDYCLHLDRTNKPLARFVYAHVAKRLGEKPLYMRNVYGFLGDVGLGYWLAYPAKIREHNIRTTLYPTLEAIKGHGFSTWHTDNRGNLVFIP